MYIRTGVIGALLVVRSARDDTFIPRCLSGHDDIMSYFPMHLRTTGNALVKAMDLWSVGRYNGVCSIDHYAAN
jgi:hypothetical protein